MLDAGECSFFSLCFEFFPSFFSSPPSCFVAHARVPLFPPFFLTNSPPVVGELPNLLVLIAWVSSFSPCPKGGGSFAPPFFFFYLPLCFFFSALSDRFSPVLYKQFRRFPFFSQTPSLPPFPRWNWDWSFLSCLRERVFSSRSAKSLQNSRGFPLPTRSP